MKLVVLYRPKSSHSSSVEEFVRYFKQRDSETETQVLDMDSLEGTNMATLYDIVAFPSVMVVRDDGSLQKLWQGELLPLVDEVESYFVA